MNKYTVCYAIALMTVFQIYPSIGTDQHAFIDELYKDISGFVIQTDEQNLIYKAGGDPTYGEIKTSSLAMLLKDLKLTNADVWYDLGCGVGKTCTQVICTSPAKKAVGIELSPTRVAHAQQIKKYLAHNKLIPAHKSLNFVKGNITKARMDDATVVFMCSTCFDDKLMNTIVKKLGTIKNKNLRVLTLRQLPENSQFKLVKIYNRVPMTWSEHTTVYLYEKI